MKILSKYRCMQHLDETCGSQSREYGGDIPSMNTLHTQSCESKQSLESAQRRFDGSLNREEELVLMKSKLGKELV